MGEKNLVQSLCAVLLSQYFVKFCDFFRRDALKERIGFAVFDSVYGVHLGMCMCVEY